MKFQQTLFVFLVLISISGFQLGIAQEKAEAPLFVNGDALYNAPELAARGSYKVGVRTLTVTNPDQINVAAITDGIEVKYDRSLTLEVWYPASLEENDVELTAYEDVLGRPNNEKRPLDPFTFHGRASRDANPMKADGGYPLVIVSHGYLGSRVLMTYLTENLASKGYVVAAIDHKESTHSDPGPFPATLYHRPYDIMFVLDEMAKMGATGSDSFLAGMVDEHNAAIIGYSMGGYGVLNVAGAGYSTGLGALFKGMTKGSDAIKSRIMGSSELTAAPDPRIKAVIAFAPWGMERGVWDSTGLAGLRIPTLFVAGDQDDISGYEKGIKAIYDGATNVERYMLTYINARHNVAPNPPPIESFPAGPNHEEYMHYAEPAWDMRHMNNVNQHFVTAFLGIKLKGKDYGAYLDLKENSNGEPWKGFKPRSSLGMEWRKGQ